jgi:hypothetical protein
MNCADTWWASTTKIRRNKAALSLHLEDIVSWYFYCVPYTQSSVPAKLIWTRNRAFC